MRAAFEPWHAGCDTSPAAEELVRQHKPDTQNRRWEMAAKKANRAKKGVAKAKATRKSSVRSARKAPKVGKSTFPPEALEIF